MLRFNGFTLLTSIALLSSGAYAGTVFTDNTFNLANYSNPFLFIHNDPGGQPNDTGGTISIDYSQCAACGNPGQGLQATITVVAAEDATTQLDLGLLNTGFVYDPSVSGSIGAVFASIDNEAANNLPGLSQFDIFNPLIEQDGNYYVAEIFAGPGISGFANLSGDLTAANFWQFNPANGASNSSSHPNFGGDAMEFGLMIEGGALFVPQFVTNLEYDNLEFDLSPAPEPASFLLLGAGLAGLAMLRRRKV